VDSIVRIASMLTVNSEPNSDTKRGEEMDLETIKKYDDSVWLYILKQKTVFDTDLIKAQKDWLIEKIEKQQKQITELICSIYEHANEGTELMEIAERIDSE
jgi:hypothetical protein